VSETFCLRHHPHFCPCIAPSLYEDAERARREWDYADAPRREEDEPERDEAAETLW
jgi:hypothetical protein